jgi:hypothetical protein
MKIMQILTPSATMWDALRNGGQFVAQQKSATPAEPGKTFFTSLRYCKLRRIGFGEYCRIYNHTH